MTRAFVVGSAALLFAAPAGWALDASRYRYTRELQAAGPGVARFEPDARLFAHARPLFADLRIVDVRRREVPWRALTRRAAPVRAVRVLNSGSRRGKAVALVDLGARREARTSIELEIPDRGFVGRVTVSGSDDRRRFTRLSTTAIYDVAGARHARSTTAVFSPTDFRYLLLQASGVSAITGAIVAGRAVIERPIVRPLQRVRRRDEARRTVLTADLGFRNVPVDQLRIASRTPRFDRFVVVEGSNAGAHWTQLARARIARFEDSPAATTIDLAARHRRLRVIVENGDDAPLAGLELRATARTRTLAVSDGFRPPYKLYYGDPRARPPVYDFARVPQATLPRPIAAALGPERLNQAFEPPPDTRAFSERHPWIVEASLALAALVLSIAGLLALRRRA